MAMKTGMPERRVAVAAEPEFIHMQAKIITIAETSFPVGTEGKTVGELVDLWLARLRADRCDVSEITISLPKEEKST